MTHLDAMNFDFRDFCTFLKAEIHQISKTQSPKKGKNGSFKSSTFSKIDFT